jgi:hypothetical protein
MPQEVRPPEFAERDHKRACLDGYASGAGS